MSTWSRFVDEKGAPAVTGSEGGTIVLDEEHGLGARITLEKDGAIAPLRHLRLDGAYPLFLKP